MKHLAMIALCACTSRHVPDLAPRPGVIEGHATGVAYPGAKTDRPPIDITRACAIRAVGLDGTVRETRSDEHGAYSFEVPAGPYVISFEGCGGPSCHDEHAGAVHRIAVAAGARITHDYECHVDSK